MYVGTVVTLKQARFSELEGAVGVCYNVYDNKKGFGSSFIFENGNYIDLTLAEMNQLLHVDGFSDPFEKYQFPDIKRVIEGYQQGMFDAVLKNKQYTKYSYEGIPTETKENVAPKTG